MLKVMTDGRVKFTQLSQRPNPKFLPDERDIYALEFIHRHGLVASNILRELMKDVKGTRNFTNFYDWLMRLYDGMLLERPPAQRYTEQPDGNFHVFRLTARGERMLERAGKLLQVVKHSGMFPHQLMGATFTATVDIMCRRAGYRFIPAHEYLGGVNKKLEIPFPWNVKGQNTVIDGKLATFDPDYIYAIQYGPESFLGFLPEFNRDTEPQQSVTYARRTDLKTIRQIERLIGEGDYKELYDKESPLIFQFVTVTNQHAATFIELAKQELKDTRYITANVMPTFASPFNPSHFQPELFCEPWLTIGKSFTITRTA